MLLDNFLDRLDTKLNNGSTVEVLLTTATEIPAIASDKHGKTIEDDRLRELQKLINDSGGSLPRRLSGLLQLQYWTVQYL